MAEHGESGIDKIAKKAKQMVRGDKDPDALTDRNFQNAPDEGSEDVPTEDKIIEDHRTGEKTFVKNETKR